MEGMCNWCAPRASTPLEGLCVNSLIGSIPIPSRHIYITKNYILLTLAAT